MVVTKNQWAMKKGDPTKLGATRVGRGYNFAVKAKDEESLELLFYKNGKEEPEQILAIPDSYRTGNIVSVFVEKENLSAYEYRYRQGEETFLDPCVRMVSNPYTFGQKQDSREVRGKVLEGLSVIPSKESIPFEEMLIYKVHVRGYTMQKNSRVRKKGTFHGLMEKIPYWKELGINTLEFMPIYDFEEYPEQETPVSMYQMPIKPVNKVNYWGYTKGNYFAPKLSYCGDKNPEKEIKLLISKLHEEGMECLLDFFFPREISPTFVVDVLRFWHMEYQVDGFVVSGEGAWMDLLARDEVLAQTKIFCPGCDMIRLYDKNERKRRLAEYHPGFQNTMRRFLKGDEDQVNGFMYYNRRNPFANGVVNYMANHDGFTLADLVSYDYRHNEENGEENQDGNSCNYSWNCGVEGPTRKNSVLEMRNKQLRNAMLLLFLSQGTPLLYGGDEFGNSQNGNNNAYCQDNEIGWIDWSKEKKYAGFTTFVKDLIRFRKRHPILHTGFELRPTDYKALGWPEISYHSNRGWYANTESTSREIGVLYCGAYVEKADGEPDDFIYVMYNMHWNRHEFALPFLPEGKNWYVAIDSGKKAVEAVSSEGEETLVEEEKTMYVPGRTIIVLIGK